MVYVVPGISVFLLLLIALVFFRLLQWQNQQHQQERQAWEVERANLLNRCMAKDLQAYQILATLPTSHSISNEEVTAGLSDEEELRRIGQFEANGKGLGEEIVVDMTEDLRELGLIPEN